VTLLYTQADRDELVASPERIVARKRARIVAVQLQHPFYVETDRGTMAGEPGDWLVTNHPDDDAGSDLWTISSERFAGTYVIEEGE
jgi:hypothetical protein